MKTLITVMAAWLAIASGAASAAATPPSRQLVADYLTASGLPQEVEKTMAVFNKDLVARAGPGQADKITQAVTATLGWPSLKEEFVSLIQGIYTTEDLKAMIAFSRSPSGRGLVEKDQRFYSAMSNVLQKRAKTLSDMMPPEVNDAPVPVVKMGEGSKTPVFSYDVPPQPVYPAMSRANNEQGVVRLRVLLSATGDVEAVGVLQSSGFQRLDEAALAALARAKFKVHPENGTPTRSYVPVSLTFALEDDKDE